MCLVHHATYTREPNENYNICFYLFFFVAMINILTILVPLNGASKLTSN